MNEPMKIPTMLTIRETAEMFKLPIYFVRQKVNSGEVVSVRAGRKFLVNAEKFAEYLNAGTATEAAPQMEKKPRIAPIPLR